MKNLQLFAVVWLMFFSASIVAEEVVSVTAMDCVPGIHKQPHGPFALHVFCDDALGTNIAVFLDSLGAPYAGNYFLGKRFWQGEEWGNDVTSYSWLENDYLLLSTSHIYGSGAIYKLNLKAQTFEIVRPPDDDICVTKLKTVQDGVVDLDVTDCESLKDKTIEFAL